MTRQVGGAVGGDMICEESSLWVGPVYDEHVVGPVDAVKHHEDAGEQVERHSVDGLLQLLWLLIAYVLPYLSVEPGRLWPLGNERIVLGLPPAVPDEGRLPVTAHHALPAEVSVGLQASVQVTFIRPARKCLRKLELKWKHSDGVISYSATLDIDILSQFFIKKWCTEHISDITFPE